MLHWIERARAAREMRRRGRQLRGVRRRADGRQQPDRRLRPAIRRASSLAACWAPRFAPAPGLPVINIAGCAPHPGWIAETLAALALGDVESDALDSFGRPRFFADHLAHHGCARNEYLRIQGQRRGAVAARLPDGASRLQGDAGGRRLQSARLERRRLLHQRRLCLHRLHLAGLRDRRRISSRPPSSAAFRSACRSTCRRPGSSRSRRCRNRRRRSGSAPTPPRIMWWCRRAATADGANDATHHHRAVQPRRGRSRSAARYRRRRGESRPKSPRRCIAASSRFCAAVPRSTR